MRPKAGVAQRCSQSQRRAPGQIQIQIQFRVPLTRPVGTSGGPVEQHRVQDGQGIPAQLFGDR